VTWQTVSGLDLNSSYQAVDVPASLLAAFEQEVIYPDWTELLNIAAQYSAPSVTGVPLTHGKPGPSLQLSAAVVVVVEPTPTPTPEPTPTPTKPGKGGGRGKVK
jgi:hypothetical protein